jgi:hypothetical protein
VTPKELDTVERELSIIKRAVKEAERDRSIGSAAAAAMLLSRATRLLHALREAPAAAPFGDIFVAHDDGTFECEPCAAAKGIDFGDDDVNTWEVGGGGWLGPVVCCACKLSIPVYVNGNDEEEL